MALTKRCAVLDRLGRFNELKAAAEALCRLEPRSPDALRLLGDALQKIGQLTAAVATYDLALGLDPGVALTWYSRAKALADLEHNNAARESVLKALAINPCEPEGLTLLGNLEKRAGHLNAAKDAYRRALAVRPVKTCFTPRSIPEFRALFLLSPIAGNTPFEDITSASSFESRSIMLIDGFNHEIAKVTQDIDIVFNLISDADCGREELQLAKTFVDGLSLPVLNHPAAVAKTDRESISRRLANVPGLHMPWTRKVMRDDLMARGIDAVAGFQYPAIIRLSGTHGGEKMELLATASALSDYLAATEGDKFYLTQYVDYRSPDGLFRKYRYIFVNGEILPYHLAIGDDWKVHHASTRMVDTPWMQDEERAFLEAPHSVFDAQAYNVLRAIQNEIGLDYFGIDCAIDRAGHVLAFEVNSTMLVHMRNTSFPYKDPHVRKIKDTFAKMLAKAVGNPGNQ